MTWFYRAVELPDGQWACRHGLVEYDNHRTVDAALRHLRQVAPADQASTFYVHPLGDAPRQVR